MTISVECFSWLEKKRKTFHVLPSIMIDYQKFVSSKHVTFILSWLFWSAGISFGTDD